MSSTRLSSEQLAQFDQDGFVVLKALFDSEEMELLLRIAKADRELEGEAYARKDAAGNLTKLSLRNDLTEDIYSAIVRCHRVVDPVEQVLGGEVYHYHHKMMLKEPRVGGAWEWHQDYGYWYNNGCLFPLMASCMIAVDRASRANGCLQVLKGSHLMGRIDHGKVGDQAGADMERVKKAMERMELVHCELDPGDALLFHCNLLHRSDMNRSEHARWTLIGCYNAARNNPYKQHKHPFYSYLEKWPDERVREIGRSQWESIQASTPS